MPLSSALQIGRSGLLASQVGIEVAGSNLANLATRGYHRQRVELAPARPEEIRPGVFAGRGVRVQAIQRQIDTALEARLRSAIADAAGSGVTRDLLTQVESIENELSDGDISDSLAAFFNTWSDLSTRPQDLALRSLVVEEGRTLADGIQGLRGGLLDLRDQAERRLGVAADAADSLLTRIQGLNAQIAAQEAGLGSPEYGTPLRDERGVLLEELARYIDISTIERDSGVVDVYVGSLPAMINGKSRGLELRTRTIDNQLVSDLVISADKSRLDVSSGEIGALIRFRDGDLAGGLGSLDTFASELITAVNQAHATGQGLELHDQVTGTVQVLDPSLPLNDAAAGLAAVPVDGSLQVHVTQKSTGARVTSLIDLDLDGLGGDDTTLTALAASINGISNLKAEVLPNGRLRMGGDTPDYAVSFTDDSAGVLAALGLGGFFEGRSAFDLRVSDLVAQDPRKVAAAQDHLHEDNRNALAIAALADATREPLGGQSISGFWSRHVEGGAIRLGNATAAADADGAVVAALEQQRQAVSGVNPDEEAIDLIQYQRAFQASARFLSTVDEMMTTLINMV